MNIFFLTESLGNGGAERVTTELIKSWTDLGHNVTIIQTDENKFGTEYSLPKNISKINISNNYKFRPFKILKNIQSLIKILKTNPEYPVITFLQQQCFMLSIASFFVPNKIIMSERNDPTKNPGRKITRKLRDWSFLRADKCVFQTELAKKHFSKSIQEKGTIIPNPINGNLPDPWTGERDKRIVMACRLNYQKNIPMAINAFKKLHTSFPDYKLEIYGQGRLKEELEKNIYNLGLKDSILLKGFSNSLLEDIKSASIYISTSDYEGISNALLEALGMGIPTIATDCPVGGTKMVIKNNENGILIPVGDERALLEGMKRIITKKDFSQYLSSNAIKVREQFPLDKISNKWIELIK